MIIADKSLPQSEEPAGDASVSSLSSSVYELYDCRPAAVADRPARVGQYATLGSVRSTKSFGACAISEDWTDEGPASGTNIVLPE